MMRNTPLWLAATLLALLPSAVAAQSGTASKKLYCWNQNGQRICSDALPAEAVNAAREEISVQSGLKVGEVQRALTEEERAQAAVDAAQRQLDLAAEETRRRTDEAMLLSYRTEEELRRVFGERTAIVDNNIRTARFNVASLRDGLVSLLQTTGDRELAGKPIPAEMTSNIRQRHNALLRQHRLQQNFEKQRVELDAEIAEILHRYRVKKGLLPAASPESSTAANPPAAKPTSTQ
ncbi:hypothetical protein [Pseudoxanthomonas sp. UTMC 1351]|uniref:hypothetical protein n=1 Tax=Pseudoxanthomonas sp. UTMC 1351 TaxID=2695853 RepID=UPI0034CE77C0